MSEVYRRTMAGGREQAVMNFGRVYGRARRSPDCAPDHLRIDVSLEAGNRIRVVREECVALPMIEEKPLSWWADQFTQETIGTLLALEGWEAFATSESDTGRASSDAAVVTYVVRRV